MTRGVGEACVRSAHSRSTTLCNWPQFTEALMLSTEEHTMRHRRECDVVSDVRMCVDEPCVR